MSILPIHHFLKTTCAIAALCLSNAAFGQFKFYVGAGAGRSVVYLKESTLRGQTQPCFTADVQCGISGKHLAFSYSITGQQITETAFIPHYDGLGRFVANTQVDYTYGKLLLTNELLAQGKINLGKLSLCLGPVIGFVHTTGKADNRFFTGPTGVTHTHGNYGGGWGSVFGAQANVGYSVTKHLSVQAGAAYKAVAFDAELMYYDVIDAKAFRLAIVPVTAGLRYTF